MPRQKRNETKIGYLKTEYGLQEFHNGILIVRVWFEAYKLTSDQISDQIKDFITFAEPRLWGKGNVVKRTWHRAEDPRYCVAEVHVKSPGY